MLGLLLNSFGRPVDFDLCWPGARDRFLPDSLSANLDLVSLSEVGGVGKPVSAWNDCETGCRADWFCELTRWGSGWHFWSLTNVSVLESESTIIGYWSTSPLLGTECSSFFGCASISGVCSLASAVTSSSTAGLGGHEAILLVFLDCNHALALDLVRLRLRTRCWRTFWGGLRSFRTLFTIFVRNDPTCSVVLARKDA